VAVTTITITMVDTTTTMAVNLAATTRASTKLLKSLAVLLIFSNGDSCILCYVIYWCAQVDKLKLLYRFCKFMVDANGVN
jgi:hypothetical protein